MATETAKPADSKTKVKILHGSYTCEAKMSGAGARLEERVVETGDLIELDTKEADRLIALKVAEKVYS